jgi:hypothetical protein
MPDGDPESGNPSGLPLKMGAHSSNLLSSATADQLPRQAGHALYLTLRSWVVSFAVSFTYAYQDKSVKPGSLLSAKRNVPIM